MTDTHQRPQQLAESANKQGMDKAFTEITPRKMSAMDDKQLAEWQGGFTPQHPGYLLAQNEWNRRLLKDSNKAVIIATLAGAFVGAIITASVTLLSHKP